MHFLIKQDFLNCGIFNFNQFPAFSNTWGFPFIFDIFTFEEVNRHISNLPISLINNCKLWKRKRYFWTNILLCECPKVISSQFVCLSACQLSLVLSMNFSLQPSIALGFFFFYLSSNKLLYLFHSPGPIFLFFLLPLFMY